jgi:hypothetical protein
MWYLTPVILATQEVETGLHLRPILEKVSEILSQKQVKYGGIISVTQETEGRELLLRLGQAKP